VHAADGRAQEPCSTDEALLFAQIADALRDTGYAVCPGALPSQLATVLQRQLAVMHRRQFAPAGVGREDEYAVNYLIRTDEICWISGDSEAGTAWLAWAERLRCDLNRRLLLGLFSFESHFSHYAPGDFYRKHSDAFRGEANRVLSVVAYLNNDWQPDDGGELQLYLDESGDRSLRIVPQFATVVVFLSEEFPHEVLPTKRDRYAIAGWYRVNSSRSDRVDPPR